MQTKQEYAYTIIKNKIITGEFLPGQRIVANQIAQEIGTSAIPVREALLKLQSEKLIAITPHIGAVVSLVTTEEILMTLEPLAVLEGYATRLAFPHAKGILPKLHKIDEATKGAIEKERWDKFSYLNREFHFTIYGASENTVLINTIAALWSQLDSFLSNTAFYLIPERARGSVADHERIIELLADAKTEPVELELFSREHKLKTARHFKDRRSLSDTRGEYVTSF